MKKWIVVVIAYLLSLSFLLFVLRVLNESAPLPSQLYLTAKISLVGAVTIGAIVGVAAYYSKHKKL